MRLPSLLVCFAAVSLAQPTRFFDDIYNYSENLAEFYSKVSEHINNAKHQSKPSMACNPSTITLPSFASGLPSPTGLSPMYVALGRGTQNYTCADSTENSIPVAIGALANLYNATCIASNFPDLMEMLPNIAYNIPLPDFEYTALPPANIDLMGHHFFYDSTTPEFNLDTTTSKQYGVAMTKKQSSINAPSDAFKGDYGAVAWLYLTTTTGTVGNYKSVYRVNTAGGNPPTTCKGMPSVFTMQYSANYYFFGSS
ncbi:hypothetical protein N7474_005104 [Penicillium riverlandense]|uniref:uncharacterized protein n=1 Tax=Penicillium riverlandense TaxID=1903569 RepID=UPI002546983E|nr:uncharacterized protein N7474_005104 [Penicillium riverlandense]KAJ5819513.1 hypothetical protein N7474_005104 [Penicillium riverlandense]